MDDTMAVCCQTCWPLLLVPSDWGWSAFLRRKDLEGPECLFGKSEAPVQVVFLFNVQWITRSSTNPVGRLWELWILQKEASQGRWDGSVLHPVDNQIQFMSSILWQVDFVHFQLETSAWWLANRLESKPCCAEFFWETRTCSTSAVGVHWAPLSSCI